MTRAVRSNRILKDANGDITDHLRNHIHLTNCIHLKNHMHKQSPILNDRSLMRELSALQRSRSLRDPSASPPAWHSPVLAELLSKSHDRDTISTMHNNARRRSTTGVERAGDGRISVSSPAQESVATSKVAGTEANGVGLGVELGSERSSKSGARGARRIRKKESGDVRNDFSSGGYEGRASNANRNELAQGISSANSDQRSKKSGTRGKHGQVADAKTLSQQLDETPVDGDDVVSSYMQQQRRQTQHEKTPEPPEPCFRASCSGLNRVNRRKFRRIKRAQAPGAARHTRTQNEMSVASNSSVHANIHHRGHVGDGQDVHAHNDVSGAPKNGCGMPWNWSRIHDRGRSFLDLAGRSLSCGLSSDSRLKRGGAGTHARDNSDFPEPCYGSTSSSRSDSEALPLLVDGSGSQVSTENAAWAHDYSGELGIFADSLLKRDVGSDLASEGRSGDQRKLRGDSYGRHQCLTQKYMPRTFRDLVGQNLVAQALSNAVVRRKVGLLYVFYGPHGTGKTSCARIFSRALNCQSLEHPKPCGFCGSCIAHDMGKSRNIIEVGPVSNFDYESIMDLLDGMSSLQKPSHYKVFIFDECDNLSPDSWSAISKAMDRAPRRMVFILICSNLDVLPHVIISRCQKFFFPKLRDADIIYGLQWVATKEGLDIDKDALKLIASRSDGSLRDAEMTLEQLSLLGQRISVTLVQELVGLISDEKLIDLLDLALSADTINTVKNLREIMESGVEPLPLMSQLATVITDILAGSYDFSRERRRRKFFRRQALSKEEMEKLRQALKTLSEAEKQLRMSNDKLTWLTAALLQLAPDQQYMLPSSSTDTSFNHSPLAVNNNLGRDAARKASMEHTMMPSNRRGLANGSKMEKRHGGGPGHAYDGSKEAGSSMDRRKHVGSKAASEHISSVNLASERVNGGQNIVEAHTEIDEIWLEVLQQIQITCIKEFLYQEGKLMSVSFGAAPTIQLMFSSPETKSKAEKFRAYIIQAFESVLDSPVIIEIRCESRKMGYDEGKQGVTTGTCEIVEMAASPRERINVQADTNGMEVARVSEAGHLHRTASLSERRQPAERKQCQSIVRSKVSLAHVIQQAEGSTHRGAWTKRKAVSIAEKLEQENLRLEPRSRSFLCWKASKATRRKLSRLRTRTRRPHSLLKLVSCGGKCMSSRSPR